MKIPWKKILLWVGICLAVGAVAGLLTREGTALYASVMQKPPLSPPGWVFPVVWTVLYTLMGIGTGLVQGTSESKARSLGLNFMVAQLVVNFFWPLFFFNLQAYGFSLVWLLLLWGLVAGMVLQFRKVMPLAAKLQIPYLLWLTFAVYLNAGVWWLNM